ncbi:hypothetical protein GGS21DRAFT_527690 [Xylaria nigripes]|nr:hypothetical protein GGS21DRAFT_527690 [Xylaria nigripes]
MVSEEWSDSDEHKDIPLQHRRPFGSGLKRKQVVFVPASSESFNSSEEYKPSVASKPVSDIYLSIVLPKEGDKAAAPEHVHSTGLNICNICRLPLNENSDVAGSEKTSTRPHEASIAHQVCISHSHPPSALDRSRMGLSVLQAQGWDPDARTGLGASNQGISFPIKAKPKNNTLGLGVKVPKDLTAESKKQKKAEKPQLLDAKKVRKAVAQDKKRHQQLRHQFYGNSEVERYLGSG